LFVVVNRAKCTGLGICESIVPDLFEIAEDGTLTLLADLVDNAHRADVEEAVRSCPTAALRLSPSRQ